MSNTNRSQATPVGANGPTTWDELYDQCEMTFSGGHIGEKRDAFLHGMRTVCNLLNAEYPEPVRCAAAPDMLQALLVLRSYFEGKEQIPNALAPAIAAIAKATAQ